jgi:hypothetical protein
MSGWRPAHPPRSMRRITVLSLSAVALSACRKWAIPRLTRSCVTRRTESVSWATSGTSLGNMGHSRVLAPQRTLRAAASTPVPISQAVYIGDPNRHRRQVQATHGNGRRSAADSILTVGNGRGFAQAAGARCTRAAMTCHMLPTGASRIGVRRGPPRRGAC